MNNEEISQKHIDLWLYLGNISRSNSNDLIFLYFNVFHFKAFHLIICFTLFCTGIRESYNKHTIYNFVFNNKITFLRKMSFNFREQLEQRNKIIIKGRYQKSIKLKEKSLFLFSSQSDDAIQRYQLNKTILFTIDSYINEF